jgi:hypothetical protein
MEHKVNPNLERYLRLAAWGLPHKKRLEVRNELRSNIEMLAQEYQIQGHSQQQALELALRDFGAPERVCVGMGKVYIMPTIFRNATLMALVATLSISTFNSSTAQITGTNFFPSSSCLDENKVFYDVGPNQIMCEGGTVWIQASSIRSTLEPLGVKIKESEVGQEKSLTLIFPNSQNPITIKIANPKQTLTWDQNFYEVTIKPDSIHGTEFVQQLQNTHLPVVLQGWNNPYVSVGTTKFWFGTEQQVFKGENIYPDLMLDVITREMDSKLLSVPLITYERINMLHSMKHSELNVQNIALPKGSLDDTFILCSREQRTMRRPMDFFICRVQPLNATKGIAYFSRAKNLTFVKKLSTKYVQLNGNGEAILYRFTGRIDKNSLEVVPPEQIKILK